MPQVSRVKLLAAFAAIYVIWGSTYLAILMAIQTLPPLLMASARFLVAGLSRDYNCPRLARYLMEPTRRLH